MLAPSALSPSSCLDCGEPITGRFCASCGQRADPLHKSLREFVSEFTEGLTNFDAKLWRTLPALLLRPGLLTAEFNAGRRTRYVHPFRVYLFVTFVFFGLVAAFGHGTTFVQVDATPSSQEAPNAATVHSPVDDFLITGAEKVKKAGDKELAGQFAQHLPQVMFVVMPIAALLLKAAYGRRRFYVEHLVFVTHVHSFVFVLLAGFFAIPSFARGPWGMIPVFAALVYFGVALKRVYAEGTAVTLAKGAALAAAYGVVVVIGMVATSLLVILAL
jgi:hypothetical protein